MCLSQREKQDILFMERALSIAACAQGTTMPNPMVGAVVVQAGSIVGEGYHQHAGKPHAEVLALEAAGARAVGSALYVTLEPCAHQGRTGPCVDAISAAGVTRVVIASLDPNPAVCGGGAELLRKAGIEVTQGILAEKEAEMNAEWRAQLNIDTKVQSNASE